MRVLRSAVATLNALLEEVRTIRLIVSGGGTGGHIYPAIAIAKKILKFKKNLEVLFVGSKIGLEAQIVPKENLPFKGLTIEGGLERGLSIKNLRRLYMAIKSVPEAIKVINEFDPQVVVGTGGWASAPIVLAATVLGRRTLIHEQNVVAGITNRFLGHFVDKVALGYPQALAFFDKSKCLVTGNPVRDEFRKLNKKKARERLGLDLKKKLVLVVGGSSGARKINEVTIEMIKQNRLQENVQVVLSVGHGNYENALEEIKNVKENIKVVEYIYDMPTALNAADLVVSRAGAGTIAEIQKVGRPAILVPYPYAAYDHQSLNAKALVEAGAAIAIADCNLDQTSLAKAISTTLFDVAALERMTIAATTTKDATTTIANFILKELF